MKKVYCFVVFWLFVLALAGLADYLVPASEPVPVADPSPHYCPCCDPHGTPAPALPNL
jgi:hypothetical protein